MVAGCLSAGGAKNVSWPWPSLLRGWGSLNMAFTGKFVYNILKRHYKETEKSILRKTMF